MSKHFKTILTYKHRFKVVSTGWASVQSILLNNKIIIGLSTRLSGKSHRYFSNTSAIGFETNNIKRIGRTVFKPNIKIKLSAVIKRFGKVTCLNPINIDFAPYLKRKNICNFIVAMKVDYKSVVTRFRRRSLNNDIRADFSAFHRKKAALYFDNRKITIYTLTLLKSLTVGELKKRNIGKLKQESRYMPQFKVDFDVNLRKREV